MRAFMAERIIAHFVKQWPNSTTLDRAAANSEQRQERCSFVVNMIMGKQAHTSLHGRKDHSSLCQTMAKRATLDRLAANKKNKLRLYFVANMIK